MLRIYEVILDLIKALRPLLGVVERHDADLGRQMRRAMHSSVLNVGEGMYSRGRNRKARYHSALGSTREVLSVLEVADAMGYIQGLDPERRRQFDRIIGTLVKLVR
jgi:four helix bundle protein